MQSWIPDNRYAVSGMTKTGYRNSSELDHKIF